MITDLISIVVMLSILIIFRKRVLQSDKDYGKYMYLTLLVLLSILLVTGIIFRDSI